MSDFSGFFGVQGVQGVRVQACGTGLSDFLASGFEGLGVSRGQGGFGVWVLGGLQSFSTLEVLK